MQLADTESHASPSLRSRVDPATAALLQIAWRQSLCRVRMPVWSAATAIR